MSLDGKGVSGTRWRCRRSTRRGGFDGEVTVSPTLHAAHGWMVDRVRRNSVKKTWQRVSRREDTVKSGCVGKGNTLWSEVRDARSGYPQEEGEVQPGKPRQRGWKGETMDAASTEAEWRRDETNLETQEITKRERRCASGVT